MTAAPFDLTPSPADPQPVKVYMLDDCTWWAGYSLEQCIDDAIAGEWCDQHSILEPRECTPVELERLNFIDWDEPDGGERSFAAELQRRIDAGEHFPQFFASTEY